MSNNNYLLLDSGDQKKLEKVGKYTLIRPSSAAIWKPLFPEKWEAVDAIFSRDKKNSWILKKKIPSFWNIELEQLLLKISLTDFGHLGVFPEHALLYKEMEKRFKKRKNPHFLNLFAYTGGATLVAAKLGAKVCHVDASRPSVLWAKENAALNYLEKANIRWIVDDVKKFLKREIKRKVIYDGILLDPPTFGRGAKGEVFKIEQDLFSILEMCKSLLAKDPLFLILSCHTPGFSETTLENLVQQIMQNQGRIKKKEILLHSFNGFSLPSGNYVLWER